MRRGESGDRFGTGSWNEVLDGGREIISGTTLFPLNPACEAKMTALSV